MSYSPKNLIYRYTVGNGADFASLAEAVTWFNANGIGDSELLLDGGHQLISDTIHIHSVSSYNLNIRGLDSGVTYLDADTGLAGKPMFDIVTPCDFRQFYADGSTLAGYGVNAGEDCFSFSTTADMYSEISDIFIEGFYTAINDTIGSDLYVFNFGIDTCQTGIAVNYTTNSPTTSTSLDCEVGTFEHCPIGINLLKTGAAKKARFYLANLIFQHQLVDNSIGIKYTISDYVYGAIAFIGSCSSNNVGELTSGFDFSNAINANISIIGNIGVEDSKPHAKISVYNGASPVTVTSSGVYYKAAFVNSSTYTTKMTLTNNKMLYQSSIPYDGMMWLSGSIAVNQNNRTLDVGIRREVTVTSVSGNGALTTVTTTNDHNMETGQQVQMLAWTVTGSGTPNGVRTITRTGETTFTFASNLNGTAATGTCGNLMGLVSVRTTTSGASYPFSTNCYVEDMVQNGYSEIYVTSSSSGDAVTLTDVAWLFNTI